MRIMMVGDIYARPGRQASAHFIPMLRREYQLDLVIANGENSAGGVGITAGIFSELIASEIDVITTGNHVWDKKEIYSFIDGQKNLLRPANYPPGTKGHGVTQITINNFKVCVINLSGRVFMPPMDCPFRCADLILSSIDNDCKIIIVDFHAEATSEKMAFGWYVDGRVSCVAGTHTHIQTADERILKRGTAYISDIGMVGPSDSVLGVSKDLVVNKFLTGLPAKFEVADGPVLFCAIIIEIDEQTGRAFNIERIQKYLDL